VYLLHLNRGSSFRSTVPCPVNNAQLSLQVGCTPWIAKHTMEKETYHTGQDAGIDAFRGPCQGFETEDLKVAPE